MRYRLRYSGRFKRQLRKALKQGKDLKKLQKAVALLAQGEELPRKYQDHHLLGGDDALRECHIEPDWLLIYEIDEGELILELLQLGSHSDLFKK